MHADQKPKERLWSRDFILITLSVFLISTAFYFLMPTLPVYVTDQFGAGSRQVGWIISVYTLAALLVRPFAGFSIDIWGRKVLFLVTLFLFGLLFVPYPLVTGFGMLMFIRFLHGMNWGIATSAGFTIVVDLVPVSKRGRGIGYFGLAFTIAMSIGPIIGLALIALNGYTPIFHAAAGIALLGAILALFIRYPHFTRPETTEFSINNLFARRSVPVTGNILILMIPMGGILTFITLYAREHGMTGYTGWFFSIMAIGTAITRIVSGSVFDRRGPLGLGIAGIVLLVTGLVLLSRAPYCSCFLISGFIMGAGFGVVIPTLQTMANNVVYRRRRGAANSTFLTGLDLGIGLGSVFAGYFSEFIGLSSTYFAMAGITLLGGIYFLLVAIPHYRSHLLMD